MIGQESLDNYLASLASKRSTPGGGAAAGVTGAQGAALIAMVCRLTRDHEELMADMVRAAVDAQDRFLQLADEDMQRFGEVMRAWRMTATTAEEQARRRDLLQASLKAAASVPREMIRLVAELDPLLSKLVELGNRNLITDIGISASLLESVILSSRLNVLVNLKAMDDNEFIMDSKAHLADAQATIDRLAEIKHQINEILNQE